ncbi:Katanin p80 WD40 repeat-containing subunit B1 [Rhizoctonia solani]|uniref:Katanin p80 WD40 repeat-containing subunit B1 n=1 Tax=Rhizoctonia solani TaxID=456999 RepID=A0A0K6GC09_9AGAM|nr:Katanin p80 WD40 repeat-containing subunit B1 [Rhizoctonia solani]
MQTTDSSNFFRSEADIAAEEARARKAERTKHIGNPIELKGKVIRLVVREGEAWTAESGSVIRRINLVTGKSVQVYRGHTGPVTCLAFFKPESDRTILLSGAWDQTIKAWDVETGNLLSTTKGHSDFLKTLLVIPHLKLLVSGSSDKHIKLWDLNVLTSLTTHTESLTQIGSTTGHTRPVECLAADPSTDYRIYSADSMGVIKAWEVESHPAPTFSRRLTHVGDLQAHTMGVTDMWVAHGRVWSASTDNTARVQTLEMGAVSPSLGHAAHVRSLIPLHLTPAALPVLITGSATGSLHIWDLEWPGDGDDPAGIDGSGARESGIVDVHSHDVTALALWVRQPVAEAATETASEGKELPRVQSAEAWVISGSLDGTLRRWRILDLLSGKYSKVAQAVTEPKPDLSKPNLSKSNALPGKAKAFAMTEDEERELAELMSDEDS